MVKIPISGTMAVVAAALIVAITLIWFPAYRVFFAISLGIGVVAAVILYF